MFLGIIPSLICISMFPRCVPGPPPRLPAAAVVAAPDGAGGREVRGCRLSLLLRHHRQQTGEIIQSYYKRFNTEMERFCPVQAAISGISG